jgi:hypothetical protein
MNLFTPVNFPVIIGLSFLIPLIVALWVGYVASQPKKDYALLGLAAVFGIAGGALVTVLAVLITVDSFRTDIQAQFEAKYQVSIVEGRVPTGPNDTSTLLLFTSEGGPMPCVVSTDKTRYTLSCDGKELQVIK